MIVIWNLSLIYSSLDSDDAHHAEVFVIKYVTVKNERSARHVSKVKQNFRQSRSHLGIVRFCPIGQNAPRLHVNSVGRSRKTTPIFFQYERHLMNMKRMRIERRVYQRPFLNGPALHHDVGLLRNRRSGTIRRPIWVLVKVSVCRIRNIKRVVRRNSPFLGKSVLRKGHDAFADQR